MTAVVPSEQHATEDVRESGRVGGRGGASSLRRSRTRSSSDAEDDGRQGDGMIEIIVRKADLERATNEVDRMDPYVRFRPTWSEIVTKTKPHVDGHRHPEWTKEKHDACKVFRFPGLSIVGKNTSIVMDIMDKNGFRADTIIGRADLDVRSILEKKSGVTACKVPVKYTGRNIGSLQIEASFVRKQDWM
eukprot:g1311.t1